MSVSRAIHPGGGNPWRSSTAIGQPRRTVKGAELVGLRYVGPFDDLPVQRGVEHRVVNYAERSAAAPSR